MIEGHDRKQWEKKKTQGKIREGEWELVTSNLCGLNFNGSMKRSES